MSEAPAAGGVVAASWIDAREPRPPAAIRDRLVELLGAEPSADPVAQCLTAAETLVASLLRNGCTARESAVDLLAADALVTYAFELASDQPETLAAVAELAMQRFAVLGAGAPA